jgi:hypothetical protein
MTRSKKQKELEMEEELSLSEQYTHFDLGCDVKEELSKVTRYQESEEI